MNGHAQTAQERKDGIIGRFTEKSLMENNTECTVVCVHVGDRGLRKECAQRVPSALCTQASPNQRRQFRLIRRPSPHEIDGCSASDSEVGLCSAAGLSLHCAGVELVETVVGQAC